MPEWTVDAQTYLRNDSAMQIEEETEMYTDLSYLNNSPICNILFNTAKIEGKKFFVKCEVFSIGSKTFKEAIKYYNPIKNQTFDSPSDQTIPVYKFLLSCQDDSTQNKLNDIWIYSYDGQGSDLIDKISLEYLNEFSSLKQENALYEKKYNAIL